MLKAALWYARRDIFVFPVHSITPEGNCDCRKPDCGNPGKHPRTEHGFKDATTDQAVIARWWDIWPTANIGIACEPTGWAVIDVDIDKGGDESLRDLEQRFETLPDTVRAITGGGGSHIVYKLPRYGFPSKVAIAPGLDTRGTGGYIVASPSSHESGGSYTWEVDRKPGQIELSEVPLWFLGEMERAGQQRKDYDSTPGTVIQKGNRDNVLASLAGSMRERGHTEEEIYAALDVTNRQRVNPPLDDAEIRRIAWSIAKYPAGKGSYALDGEITELPPIEWVDWETFWDTDTRGEDWLIEPVIPRGRSIALYSPAKQGKSLFALDIVASAATGRAVLDRPAGDPLTVVYFDLEMTEDDLYERLEDMGYGRETDLSRLFYYLLPNLPPLDTPEGGQRVLEIVDGHNADLVVIDTTSRVLRGPENDADTLRALYMFTGLPLKASNRTVLRLDHAGKSAERGQRGTSAKNDDVDLVWELKAEDSGAVTLRATHRRQSWIPETLVLERKDNPLRHERAEYAWPAGTQWLSEEMDKLDIPTDWGAKKIRKVLRENNVPGRNETIAAAIRWRKRGTAKVSPEGGDTWT
jgi:hypothetical protein